MNLTTVTTHLLYISTSEHSMTPFSKPSPQSSHYPHALHNHLIAFIALKLYTCNPQLSLPICSTHPHQSIQYTHDLRMHFKALTTPMITHSPHSIHCPHVLHMQSTAVTTHLPYTYTSNHSMPTCYNHAPQSSH